MFSSKTHKNLIIVFLMYKKYNWGENHGPRYSSFFYNFRHYLLTFYSTITHFDAFGIRCIWEYYGKSSICYIGPNAPFSIIFSKVFKPILFS